VRGRLLAVLRASHGDVPARELDMVWPDPAQRSRALAGLVADGLAEHTADGLYRLPS
jgi:A/G-specific adenine glycosylase